MSAIDAIRKMATDGNESAVLVVAFVDAQVAVDKAVEFAERTTKSRQRAYGLNLSKPGAADQYNAIMTQDHNARDAVVNARVALALARRKAGIKDAT